MTRADALRELVERMDEDGPINHAGWFRTVDAGALPYPDFADAYCGSLDAVARLEAPLRERGWTGPSITAPPTTYAYWLMPKGQGSTCGSAPSEPRARLLAVLNALLHEEDHP